MRMFKSLKLQLLFYFLITNIIVLFGFSIFIYSTAKKGVSDNLNTILRIVSIDAVPDLKSKLHIDAKDIAENLIREFAIEPLIVKIIHYNKKNNKVEYETISSKQQASIFKIPLNEMGHLHSIYYFDKDPYRISSMLLFEDSDTKIFFQLATEKNINSPYLNQLLISLAIANPIILILFLLIANMLINRTLEPVKKVVESVHNISANHLSHRISSKSIPTEIEELVDTFNELLGNLEESFKRISAFSSDASHELKTPLTVIRGEIEVALRQERSTEEYKAVLQDILQETYQVQETIDQLFLLTRKETLESNNNLEEIYLDEIITEVVGNLQKFAFTKSINIKLIKIIPITLYANETLLKIAINNIIRNAIVYSEKESEVRISITQDQSNYILSIEDDGFGIKEKELPFIFERFYRSDKARSRKDGGTGLGLSIVKMILDLHHYDICIKSEVNKGTTVVIKMPVEK